MNFEQKDIDLLEAYQAGQLSTSEVEKIEERLSSDAPFQRLFKELIDYQSGIRRIGRKLLKAELQELEKSLPAIEEEQTQVTPFFRPHFLLRAAAGVTIIFGLGILLFLMNDQPADIDVYLVAYPNIVYPVERGGQLDAVDDRQLAYQAYDREQYDLSIERFDQLNSLTEEDHFYLGLSLLLQEKYEQSAKNLVDVLASPSEIKIPARWYLGLCYLKLEEPEKAKEILQPLIDQETSYAEKAKSILNQTN